MRSLNWEKWTWVAILANVLWIFLPPRFLKGGHYGRRDLVLSNVGTVWLVVLGILMFLLMMCLYKSRGKENVG